PRGTGPLLFCPSAVRLTAATRAALAPPVPIPDHWPMTPPRWAYSFRSSDFSGETRREHADTGPLDGNPCRQGQFCAGAITVRGEADTETRQGAATYQAFCPSDRGKVATALDALPRDYAALAADLGNPGQQAGAVRSPFGPRIPLRLGSEALMRAIT